MDRWMSALAIVFLLGSGAVLSACGSPDEIDEQELEDALDDGMDGDALEDDMEDDMSGGDDDW